MSVYVSTAVWQHSQASGNTLLVLVALADQANDDGECWPKIEQIAKRCKLDRSTVLRQLKKLRDEHGELTWEDRHAAGRSSLYRITVSERAPRSSSQSATSPVANRDDPGRRAATTLVADCDEAGSTAATTRTVIETSLEPSVLEDVAPRAPETTPPTGVVKVDTARGSRLPDRWRPDQDAVDMMRAERPLIDLRAEHDKFTDYWRAQPGAKGRKVDWTATWRNWIRNARPSPTGGQQTTTRRQAERARQDAEWERRYGDGGAQ